MRAEVKRMEQKLKDKYEGASIEISGSIDGAKFTDNKGVVIAGLKFIDKIFVNGMFGLQQEGNIDKVQSTKLVAVIGICIGPDTLEINHVYESS